MDPIERWRKNEPVIICITCDRPMGQPGTQKCNYCWEVESRLESYLAYPKGRDFVRRALIEADETAKKEKVSKTR